MFASLQVLPTSRSKTMSQFIDRIRSSCRGVIVSLVIALIGVATAAAQMNVTLVPFPDGSTADAVTAFPTIATKIRVRQGSTPLSLKAGDVVIREGRDAVMPTKITDEGGGVHRVEWLWNSTFRPIIYVTKDGDMGSVSPTVSATSYGLFLRDSTGRNLPNQIIFGHVQPGNEVLLKLKLVALFVPKDAKGNEIPVKLDSIKTRTDNFRIVWRGHPVAGTEPPPRMIMSPWDYRYDLIFAPKTSDPVVDLLTVYYNGGQMKSILLTANRPPYERTKLLTVTHPNGGEQFTPCQLVDVTWKGAMKGFLSTVEYTTDDGKTWNAIDSTLDSTLVWKVPTVLSDKARIRVLQKFQSNDEMWLYGDTVAVSNIAFNHDGSRLLSAHLNGTIYEWNVQTGQRIGTYKASMTGAQQSITGLAYVGTTQAFVAALNRPTSTDQLLRFNPGQEAPALSIDLPVGARARDIGCDPSGTGIYVIPVLAARILVYDATTLGDLSPLNLGAPITAGSARGGYLDLMLMNGDLVRLAIPGGAQQTRINTGFADDRFSIITKLSVSQSGRFAGLGGETAAPGAVPRDQMTYVYDMTRPAIARMFYREVGSGISGLSFSANDGYLAMGFGLSPKFLVYDNAADTTVDQISDGHSEQVTDMEFSPDGKTLVTSSMDRTRNLLRRSFITPEDDVSDTTFSIVPIRLDIKPIVIRQQLIGTSRDTVVTANVCNISGVPLVVERAQMDRKVWVSLVDPIDGDTIQPGECFRLKLRSAPLDTGLLVDTLRITWCGTTAAVPIEVHSLNRDLTFLADMADFGDVCVGQGKTRTLAMIRNNDPEPVTINTIFMEQGLQSQFRIVPVIQDSVIPAGGTLQVEVEFRPRRSGYDTSNIVIQYAGQKNVQAVSRVTGRGSGADVQISHTVLPFIPEITEREIVLTNRSDNPVVITAATVMAGEPFTVLTPLPDTIPSHDSVRLRIRYDGGAVSKQAAVGLSFDPCASISECKLALYSSTTSLRMPVVSADPRGDAEVPVEATFVENWSYKGERFLEGAFTVNPRLFLAREITVPNGSAEILSQDIIDGKRLVRFRITSDFSANGEIARLKGWAGLAEVDSSFLVFDTTQINFGSAVKVNYVDGLLRILNPDPTRRIIDRSVAAITGIAPNPVGSTANVDLSMPAAGTVTMRCIDRYGNDVMEARTFDAPAGTSKHGLDVGAVAPGVYHVVVLHDGHTTSYPFVVLH